MTNELHVPQKVQESWYTFPYHYIASMPPHFGVTKSYDWHLNYISAMTFLLEQIEAEPENGKIVDIGCGDGRFTRELGLRFPEARVTGIDYSHKAIQLARALNIGRQIAFEERNLVENPAEADNDVAILMEVYEHIEPSNADVFLRGVRDMLRPGGVLFLTVPHINHPLSPHHFRHFDSETLRGEVSAYFDVDFIKPFELMTARRKWLNRLLINRLFVLNHPALLARIFSYYMRTMFHCASEGECQRLYVRAVRR